MEAVPARADGELVQAQLAGVEQAEQLDGGEVRLQQGAVLADVVLAQVPGVVGLLGARRRQGEAVGGGDVGDRGDSRDPIEQPLGLVDVLDRLQEDDRVTGLVIRLDEIAFEAQVGAHVAQPRVLVGLGVGVDADHVGGAHGEHVGAVALAAGEVENRPRYRLGLQEGVMAVMAAADLGLGRAGLKTYTAFGHDDVRFVVLIFETGRASLEGVIEANRLGQLRTGAASGVAATYLAKSGARTLGVIGCGFQAETQVAAIRAAVPSIERVVAYCRTPKSLERFCKTVGAEPAEAHHEAGAQEIVVAATTSKDPVLRGDWLVPGALVCAIGANDPGARELDNLVLERAAFVCCDSREQSMLESGDLIDPVSQGVLDWLEVHELQEVVAGELPGRQADDDIAVFKSNGIAAWDVAIGALALDRARKRGVGKEL